MPNLLRLDHSMVRSVVIHQASEEGTVMHFYVFFFNSISVFCFFFFSSRRRHTRSKRDWSSDVCSSDLSWTLGTVAGLNTLTAASGTLAGSPVTFSATATAGNATRLAIVTQPSASAQSGVPFLQQPVIQLQDGSGNAVGQANVAVGVKIQSGGGTLGGTTSATTGANGQAVFTTLSIAGTVGPRTLRFGASGLDSVTSTTVSVTAGTATQIAINA